MFDYEWCHQKRLLLVVRCFFACILGLLCCLVGTYTTSLAADPPNQPFDLIYEAEGVKYEIYHDGLGTLDQTEGTLANVELNGTAIVKAYLVWAGLGRDNQVQFQRVGGQAQTITAGFTWNNDTFPANTWNCCGNELSVYATDITNTGIVIPGTNSYTISEMSVEHQLGSGAMNEENWGFSLIVVYEDPTLPSERDVVIKLGNDGLFHRWHGLLGPNSDVQCFSFPSAGFERSISFSLVVGGVENSARFNALWGMSGNSATENYVDPTVQGGTWTQNKGLINLPGIGGVAGSVEIDGPEDGAPPFSDRNGDEWDDHPIFDVPIPTNNDWGCVQVESASQDQRPTLPPPGPGSANTPASIGFVGFVAVLKDPAIHIDKYTNGNDADDPNGAGVPVVAAGETVTWTYEVRNTSTISIPQTDIVVTDTVIGNITTIIDMGNGDNVLAPGEVWLYEATGTAINLANPPNDPNLALVSNVCTQDGNVTPASTAYTNIGTVTIPGASASDPSSYCGPIEGDEPDIAILKFTNGDDANDPNGTDVPVIAPSETVTWTYIIFNISTVAIPETDITVTDNVIGAVTNIVDKDDGDNILAPGEFWFYEAYGTAIDLANPPADPNLVLVPDVCTQGGNVTPASTAYTNIGTVTIPTTSASDPSSYCSPVAGDEPDIGIIKFTNGEDANDPNGSNVPVLAPGDTVNWTYLVFNASTVDIPEADITVTDNVIGTVTNIIDKDDGDTILAPGEFWLYRAIGGAINLVNPPNDPNLVLVSDVCSQGGTVSPPSTAYTNIGTVTIPTATSSDPSSYCGPLPAITIIKLTNGQDANDPNGADVPVIAPGAAVTWTYVVTNTGTVDIPQASVVITDNVIGAVTTIVDQGNGDGFLAPGEAWSYEATGTAINLVNPPNTPDLVLVTGVCTQGGAGAPTSTAYTNIGTVTIPGATASDPSSYCSPTPAIAIVKYTNGRDAKDPDGANVPVITPGETITWSYVVSNTGLVDILQSMITVTDNVIGPVTTIVDDGDGDTVLSPGETWTYAAVGTAIDLANPPNDQSLVLVANVCTQGGSVVLPSRAYTNIGTVTIPGATASDPSSYCGRPPSALEETDEPQQPSYYIFIPTLEK